MQKISSIPAAVRQTHMTTAKYPVYYSVARVTRSSADAEKLHDAPQIRNIAFENTCDRKKTFKDTQGHYHYCKL